MKSLSWQARTYILAVSVIGAVTLISQLYGLAATHNWLMLAACCLLAAPLQVLKIEGVTARSSYNLGWILYGFTFVNLGAPAAMLVILSAHLVEWVWHRYPWYIQVFNIATFSIALWLAGELMHLVDPAWAPPHVGSTIPIMLAFALLTLLNHLLVGCVIYLARNQSFAESGVLAPEALLIDFGLLGLGLIAAIVIEHNPLALLMVSLVVYMLYRAMQVPSLRRQTEVDPKTNVYNMSYFNARLADELARAQRSGKPLTLVMADLDHLREVNNSYGHLAGDIAIQGVASILTRHCRSGHIVARFGGEEFAVLMPKTPPREALAIVESMRRAVEKAVFDAGNDRRKFQVTMSFGVTGCLNIAQDSDQDDEDDILVTVEEIIEQADQALYQAKSLGRNRACLYTPVLDAIASAQEATLQPASQQAGTQPAASEPQTVAAMNGAAMNGAAMNGAKANDLLAYATLERALAKNSAPAADPATAGSTEASAADDDQPPASAAPATQPRTWLLYTFIGALTALAVVLSLRLLSPSPALDWLGIALFALLAVGAELANVEIYARQTSVSTSAALLLAGVLLFGAPAALCIGPAIAAATWFKYRSPFVRFWFNASNHVVGGLLCAGIIAASGVHLPGAPILVQASVALTCAIVLYLSSTFLVAYAIALGSGQPWRGIWAERFRWLWLHYLGLGLVAFALMASYPAIGAAGILLVLVPLVIIRYGQKQYISATEAMVHKLQQANGDLVQQKQAVDQLNREMLDLLAASLDLRNHSVQSHSMQVARYATDIARRLNLPEGRIEQVRKAALLHDIGKLAVPDTILNKPAPLSAEEYAAIQQHPVVGAALLERFSSFRCLTDFVLHHHEHFDGTGYPTGLAGAQIPLEARIVGLADAVEAMASQRPYHPAMPAAAIKDELRRCSGTQFDPHIVDVFFGILERQGDEIIVDSTRSMCC
jgi:diguanylate cyclase (GGDEF)-like protein/putative nucleotidyltransferase with HDIG domain